MTINKVYIISDGEYYKIGFSKSPAKRLKQLQTGQPNTLKLIYQRATSNARQIEKLLHTMLRYTRARHNSEWFTIDGDLNWLYEYIDSIAKD